MNFESLVGHINQVQDVLQAQAAHAGSWGSVLLIIFYVENLDVGSWGVKNDV